MSWTAAILAFVLWGFGLMSSYSLGGIVHVLVILTVIAVASRLIQQPPPAV